MSHKIATPPLAPFPKATTGIVGTVIVDGNSTSQTEDGSWANPYRTIQTALDLCPSPPTAADAIIWNVHVVPGVYTEDLVLPPKAATYLTSTGGNGKVILTGDVSWTPIEWLGPPIRSVEADINGFHITGNIDLASGNLSSPCYLTLRNVSCDGVIQDGVIATSTTFRVVLIDFRSDATPISFAAAVMVGEVTRCNFEGSVTCFGLGAVTDSDFGGNLTATTAGAGVIRNTAISGNLTVNGAGDGGWDGVRLYGAAIGPAPSYIRHSFVDGYAVLGTVNRIDDFSVDGTMTFDGNIYEVFNSTFTGLVTCTNFPLGVVQGSNFFGGVTVAAGPGGFLGSKIQGNYTGPASSYKVDGVTNARSPGVALLGGATLDLIA